MMTAESKRRATRPRAARVERDSEDREFIALAEAALVLARLGYADLTHGLIAAARRRHEMAPAARPGQSAALGPVRTENETCLLSDGETRTSRCRARPRPPALGGFQSDPTRERVLPPAARC